MLCLGDSALAETHALVDDMSVMAEFLWHELSRIYTSSSSQAIANLHVKLETMQFEENKDWDKHISSFLNIVDELASLNQEISETEKVTKLFRTLPATFDALAMASSLSTRSFEEILNAVSANIERKKTWHLET